MELPCWSATGTRRAMAGRRRGTLMGRALHAGLIATSALALAVGASPETIPSAAAAPCPDVEAVFARGTFAPPGLGGIGDDFVNALRSKKSTRLNSSHGYTSYAGFCLQNKTTAP